MKSQQIVELLRENTDIFTNTVFEAQHRTPEEIVRLGQPRHYWRARLDPRVLFDAIRGQWLFDGVKTDERVIRSKVVKSLLRARSRFDGADVALALDILKAIDAPLFRQATDAERRGR